MACKCFINCTSVLLIALYVFSQDESVPLKFLDEFDADLYSEECVGDKGHNPLHFAARCDYAQATRVILSRGYTKLLWARDTDSLYPVQIAVKKQHYSTAAVMLKAMADWSVYFDHIFCITATFPW